MHNHCIATAELQPGMVIVQVTRQNGPLKIRKSGLVSSVEMIQGLIEMGIQEVQIDPTQTVEIESPVTQRSATLTLLQSGSGPQHRQDSQLHDQFNRSLFLPSVQDIPSAWQFYARRYAVLTLLVMCGLALGFAMAYVPGILSLRSPLIVAEPVAEPLQTENAETKVSVGEDASPELTQEKVSETPQPAQAAEAEPAQVIQKPLVPVAEPVVKVPETKTMVSTQQQEPVQQPETSTESELSPELLKRFENVIKQMDKESASNELYSEPRESFSQTDKQVTPAITPPAHQSGPQNVPRLDQLPVWVINELPSMLFSAHMYASDPDERWVRVNGQNRSEGDLIDNKVRIVQIAPQHVILNYQGHEFSMLAMTDW